MKKRKWRMPVFVLLSLLLAAASAAALSVGSASISIADSIRIALSGLPGVSEGILPDSIGGNDVYIILQTRLPRVIMAVLVGAGLSVSGAVFQGIFRNPLAEPHILGVSSGAALGATIAMMSGVSVSMFGMGAIGSCAFLGAMGTIALIYVAAGLGKRAGTVDILLTGTAVSALFSAVMSLMMSMNHDKVEQIYMWTMGSLSSAGWIKVRYAAAAEAVTLPVCMIFGRELNLMAMGEETAQSLGVETVKVRRILILAAAVTVAVCVSVSGIIGFVGLVIPHIIRLVLGRDYRYILPAAALGGGIFLVVCDMLARTLTAPGQLPIGVLTAIAGAPYLVWLIRKNRR